ncbi:uncharacterized protein LACBIDRAFT_302191 [Laccaria bicolor S238N-H82]|uniref:Predicted protein n=1 Tax=Laccaria bicolor (strain S238N-H82 / ATCC MYA-4686) TaxID=486041 RepID=B0DH94_LACBS|nr:uncharacterized protein LACBIDRAFT_302191 [Laccaria bicolor S238N-H82]EDR06071.1 predicted protein [Laccaria bicolor S238N-H82]|eukprot:XP_001883359.1 predicted protein [Laccaria bicolor S238N-H82]
MVLVKRQNGMSISMQMLHQLQALVRDWLEGRLDTYMTITPAANWNHKTFSNWIEESSDWPLLLAQSLRLWLTGGHV